MSFLSLWGLSCSVINPSRIKQILSFSERNVHEDILNKTIIAQQVYLSDLGAKLECP